MYVDGVKDGTRTRAHCSPSPHFAPSELRGGTATHTEEYFLEQVTIYHAKCAPSVVLSISKDVVGPLFHVLLLHS